jgi:hypothetical protein
MNLRRQERDPADAQGRGYLWVESSRPKESIDGDNLIGEISHICVVGWITDDICNA